MEPNKIWVSWEDHRRSRELSNEFGAKYFPLTLNAKRYVRYPVLVIRTIALVIKEKPDLVFCQNPSMVLASLLICVRPLFRYKVVVDRHSNFKFETQKEKSIKWSCFHLLSRKTISRADATIVTNEYLKNHCNDLGGNAFVLQDKLPSMNYNNKSTKKIPDFMRNLDSPQVACITMFDDDEPIDEMLEASRHLPNFMFYFTGNYKKMFGENEREKAFLNNSIFAGFVSEDDYCNLIDNCDVVLVLTKKEYILNCGAYEAVSLLKPVVLAGTSTLRDYFGESIVYVNPFDSASISHGLEVAFERRKAIVTELEMLQATLSEDWRHRFRAIYDYCEQLAPAKV